MDYSRSFTLMLRWKRGRTRRQGIATVKSSLECFAKALQIALEGSIRLPSVRRPALKCLHWSQRKPFTRFGKRLLPTWPELPENPNTVASAICPTLLPKGMQSLPRLRWMRCHLHPSPTAVILSTTNTRFLTESQRWPIDSCSKASWLCSHSVLEEGPEQIPTCQQHGNTALLQENHFLPLSVCHLLFSCGRPGGKVGTARVWHTAAATDSKCGWIPIPNTCFPWLCPFPQHWPGSLSSCAACSCENQPLGWGIFNPSGMKAQADFPAHTHQQNALGFILNTLTHHLDLTWGKGPSGESVCLSTETSLAWSQGLLGSHSRLFCFHTSPPAPSSRHTRNYPSLRPNMCIHVQGSWGQPRPASRAWE